MSNTNNRNIYAVYKPDGVIQVIMHTNAELAFEDVDGDLDVLKVPDEHVDGEVTMVDVKTKRLKTRPHRPPTLEPKLPKHLPPTSKANK